jgi:hypothetical protein
MKTHFLKPRRVGCKVEPNACIFLGTTHEMFFSNAWMFLHNVIAWVPSSMNQVHVIHREPDMTLAA